MATKYLSGRAANNTGDGSTPALAKKHAAGSFIQSGDVILVERGYYVDPAPGSAYHFPLAAKNNFTIATYGEGPNPIFDSLTYLKADDAGWNWEGDGVWSKQIGSTTGSNTGTKRLFIGAYNNGNVIGQRSPGIAVRRAKTHQGVNAINYNTLAVVKQNLNVDDIWVFAPALGAKLYVYTDPNNPNDPPPKFYNGIGLVHHDETPGSTVGAVYAVQMIECQNVLIMGIDSHGSASIGFSIGTIATSKPSRNISIINCNTKYAAQGAVRIQQSIPNSVITEFPLIENVLVEDCIGDAGTHPREQEPNINYRNLSGSMDMFVALNGVKDVIYRRCKSINCNHVAFSLGQFSINHEATLTDGCGFDDCEMYADPWTNYTRGFTTYNCKANCFIRNTLFNGQSVWSQIAGAVQVYCCTWINMRTSVQKPETAGWLSGAAELLDRSSTASAWGLLRYIPTTPKGAVVAHCAVEGPTGPLLTLQTFSPYNVASVPEPTIPDNSIRLVNNIVRDTASTLVESIVVIDRATVIGSQPLENNAVYRGAGKATAKVRRLNGSGQTTALVDLNTFTGAKNNVLADPKIDLTDPKNPRLDRDSPCRRAGKRAGSFRDTKGRPFQFPPSIGPLEFTGGSFRARGST